MKRAGKLAQGATNLPQTVPPFIFLAPPFMCAGRID